MMVRAIRLSIIALIAVCSATAQNSANFTWWNSPLRADLGLTPAQDQKIREVVRAHREHLLDARNNSLKAEAALEDLLNDPTATPEQTKSVIDRVARARAESTRTFLEMSVELRRVLTIDQWRILVQRWNETKKRKPSDTQVPP